MSIARVFALALRTTEFLFYHLLISLVDRVNRLPRDGVMPEAMRLYRENIALKAQMRCATNSRSPKNVKAEARPFALASLARAAACWAGGSIPS